MEYDQVTELVNGVPQSTFVFASTVRCLWGEGCCIQLEGLPATEAMTLLERELGRPLAENENLIVKEFCEKTHGHPLVLIQSAVLVRKGMTFEELSNTVAQSEEPFLKNLFAKLSASQKHILSLLAALRNSPLPTQHLSVLCQDEECEDESQNTAGT